MKNYIPSSIDGFDHVIGGGLVGGSTILFSGFPGVGCTTLSLMVADGVAHNTKRPALFVSGDETADDLHRTTYRLGIVCGEDDGICVHARRKFDIDDALALAAENKAWLVVFNTLRSFTSKKSKGKPGSQAQAMAVIRTIVDYCKDTDTAAIVLNRLNKDGSIGGGTEVQHYVDTVLVFAYANADDKDAPLLSDGEQARLLVIDGKNRNGDVTRKSYWKMTEDGLVVIEKERSLAS